MTGTITIQFNLGNEAFDHLNDVANALSYIQDKICYLKPLPNFIYDENGNRVGTIECDLKPQRGYIQ